MSLLSRHAVFSGVAALLVLAVAATAYGQRGRVGGTVTGENGNPLAGVTITATNPTANPPEFETTTEDDGRYAVLGLASGQWVFRADCGAECGAANGEPRGFLSSQGPAMVTQTRTPPVDFQLNRILHPLEQALGAEAVEGVDLDGIEAAQSAADEAYNTGNYDQAISGYESILEQLPQLSRLHVNIGNAYAVQTQYDAAIAAYDRALEADPGNQVILVARARQRMASGTATPEELQLLEETASSLSASREDLYNQGEQAFARGAAEEAAEWYEKAISVDGNWAMPLFKRALVALNLGDIATAKEYFQRVVDVAPDSAEGAQAQATLAALP